MGGGGTLWWLDGYLTNISYHILTTTGGSDASGSGYIDNGISGGTTGNISYYDNATGTTETELVPMSFNGSSTTYFCDYGDFYSGRVHRVGGDWSDGVGAGVFYFDVYYNPTDTYTCIGGLVIYKKKGC